MSAEKKVALIQRMFEAFAHGDIQTILDNCAEDCEFQAIGPAAIPHAGTHVGREAIRDNYFGPLMATQTNQRRKIDRYVVEGDAVVAIGRYTATVISTGKTLDTPIALIFELEGGKVKRNLLLSDSAAGEAAYKAAASAARPT